LPDRHFSAVFGQKIGPKFKGKCVSKNFPVETEFRKIDPLSASADLTAASLFWLMSAAFPASVRVTPKILNLVTAIFISRRYFQHHSSRKSTLHFSRNRSTLRFIFFNGDKTSVQRFQILFFVSLKTARNFFLLSGWKFLFFLQTTDRRLGKITST
jgi:hypothetical protein